MPVVAVVNRKGGSGKSTLATHLAAYCSTSGLPVMLGDVDRQQSTQSWLRQRALHDLPHPAIVGWQVDPKNVVRPPAGVAHVVLDTPGGLRGFDLARVVMYADAVLMPICNSLFDRDSASECLAELMTLPRIASGRCRVAAIGMRLDARTRASDVLKEWARAHKVSFIGVLRETQTYVRCVEQGLTLFDLPPSKHEADLAQWKPILRWLGPVVQPVQQPVQPAPQVTTRMDAGPTTQMGVPPRASQVRPVVRPAADVARAPVAATERKIPAWLQADGPATVVGSGAPVAGETATAQAAVGALSGATATAADRIAADRTAMMPTVAAPVAATSLANPVPLAADLSEASTASTASLRPRAPPSAAGMSADASSATPPSTSSVASPAKKPTPTRVQPRPAITASRPKTIASRLGSLIDSLPIPRFLQRDS
jgi:chromosome partitioning protein